MKAKLIFARTEYDYENSWKSIKSVEIELPDWLTDKYDKCEWQLVGMERKDGE